MRARRPGPAYPPGLFGELIDILLDGWSAPLRPPEPGHTPFDVFQYHDADLAGLWREHEAYLRAEAARRRLAARYRVNGQPAYFGAWLNAPWALRGEG